MKDGYVLLCPNAHRDHGLASTLAIAEALRKHGHEVRISPFLSDGLENTWPRDIPTAALPIALPGARLVVSLGGDGTILQLSRQQGLSRRTGADRDGLHTGSGRRPLHGTDAHDARSQALP